MAAMNDQQDEAGDDAPVREARLWRDHGWSARIIKNNDDEGWAVEMTPHGQSEPALTGPWTMGRDKKNPKPLDVNAFHTLVKTANEVVRRHEQAQHALLHKEVTVNTEMGRLKVTLDITPDADDPHALLSAFDADGGERARVRVAAGFRLNAASAEAWVAQGYGRPG
jgi:hypothetical protein